VDEFTGAERALAALRNVVQAVGDDDLHRLTPCPAYDVAALTDHLIATVAGLGAAAGIPSPAPRGDALDHRAQHAIGPVLAGWRRRGLTGVVFFSGRTLPDRLALGILSLELVVHGWDLAVALHRRLDISDAHAEQVLGLAQQTLTEESRAVAGFDPPVPVPDDAGALDRLVAFTGRDPHLRLSWGSSARTP
jgi:uncharacterized protein (TIGR03086 family)